MSRIRTEITQLRRRMPTRPPVDLRQSQLVRELARWHGGTWEGDRLTSVNLPNGETYSLNTDGSITPDLARAILRAYDCE